MNCTITIVQPCHALRWHEKYLQQVHPQRQIGHRANPILRFNENPLFAIFTGINPCTEWTWSNGENRSLLSAQHVYITFNHVSKRLTAVWGCSKASSVAIFSDLAKSGNFCLNIK